MGFLIDTVGKVEEKLDLSHKSIAFEEEKERYKLKKKRPLKLKKTPQKNLFLRVKKIVIRLIPARLRNNKLIDLHFQKMNFLNIKALYRLILISPRQYGIRQELFRFTVIGLTAVFLLNVVGVYSKGKTLQKKLEAKASGAYTNLLTVANSAKQTDFMGMFYEFQNINTFIKEAEQLLTDELKITNQGVVSPLQNINLLLKAGNHLSRAGQFLSSSVYNLQNLPAYFMQQNNETLENNGPQLKLTDKIKADVGYLNLALTEIENAEEYLSEVEWSYLPNGFQEKFLQFQEKTKTVKAIIGIVQNYIPFILDLLGDRYPQRYMVLLQNNHEARATGGFIGSYLLIDVNDGEITKFELKDVYEADGQLTGKVEPPKGLHKITDNWRMRDANFSPDFPTSAKKIMWFLEHEKGPTVDTVVAINQRIVENLLAKIGEVEMPGFDFKISAENFNWIFSYLIESKFSETNSPKQFLMDFAPVLKDKLLKPENLPVLIDVLTKAIQQRDLMVYSSNAEIQNLIKKFKLDGKIIETDKSFDYLQIVNTSIGGNKSDGFINQKTEHQTVIEKDGSIVDNLKIVRKHTWYHKEDKIFENLVKQFGIGKTPKLAMKDIMGFGGNKNLIRIYVPKGSQLLLLSGTTITEDAMIYDDLDKTVFAFEQAPVYTERESTLILKYKLPQKLDTNYADNYKFIVQNQPGQESHFLNKTIKIKGKQKILNQFPQSVFNESNQKASFSRFLEGDEFVSVVVGR